MMRSILVASGLLLAAGSASAGGSFLMIPQSSTDAVGLYSAFDGALIDPNYLNIAGPAAAAGVSSTPIEAMVIGDEVWVTDQVADRIWRFGATSRQFLGDIGAGELNNIRGMDRIGDTLYVAQGSNGTTFDEGIVTIDIPTMTVTGAFNGRDPADTSYWDVFTHNGELLVTNSDSGNDGIERYAADGTFLGNLSSSDGVTSYDFMQQLALRGSGNLIGGGFSVPSGVYEIAPDGTDLGIVAAMDFGPRGVYELGNGEILWTNGTWVRTDDDIMAQGSSFRFINESPVPTPGSVVALGLSSLVIGRRRR